MYEIFAVHSTRNEILGPYGKAENVFLALQSAMRGLALAGAKVFLGRNLPREGDNAILVFSPGMSLAFRISGATLIGDNNEELAPSDLMGPLSLPGSELEA